MEFNNTSFSLKYFYKNYFTSSCSSSTIFCKRGASSYSAVSIGSETHVFISIPFSYYKMKFSAKLSTIRIFFISLPNLYKSLT